MNTSVTNNGTNKEAWHAPLNKVTPVSKILAAVIFIALPLLAFFLGMQYATQVPDNAAAAVSALGF